MDINITLLGRTAIDAAFIEVLAAVVQLDGDAVAWMPAIPAAAAGMELRLRIQAPDTVQVDVGRWLMPATEGEEPGPDPFVRGQFVAYVNAPRDIPWIAGDLAVLARPGVAAVPRT